MAAEVFNNFDLPGEIKKTQEQSTENKNQTRAEDLVHYVAVFKNYPNPDDKSQSFIGYNYSGNPYLLGEAIANAIIKMADYESGLNCVRFMVVTAEHAAKLVAEHIQKVSKQN